MKSDIKYVLEADLIRQLSLGEQDSYKILFHRYYMRVFLFVKGFVKSESLAEDIAQNIFMKLWIRRETLYGNSINNLLFTIAHNEVKDYFRSYYYTHRDTFDENSDSSMVVDDDADVLEQVEVNAMSDMVSRSVEALSERRRQIFRMSRQDNMSNKEIAAIFGISVRTVEKHIEVALKQIREHISHISLFILAILSLFND